MKILVVDDNITFLEKMEKILQLEKHNVTTASSGEEALKIIQGSNYDLLLTDLKMDKISGIDLIKEVSKANFDFISIVITGYGTIDSAIEAMKSGAYDYILKPFEFSNLKEKIKEVEMELKLRRSISSEILDLKTSEESYTTKINIDNYTSPFLIISNEDNLDHVDISNINEVNLIRFGFFGGEDVIPPSKLNILRQKIEMFVSTNDEGTIIIKGIEELLIAHNWDNFKRFILFIQQSIVSSNFSIIFIIDNKNPSYTIYRTMLHDALSLLSINAFNNIIDVISHDLRKNIINLLKEQGGLNFNKIIEELHIDNSSILAFHIKKLIKESILEKNSNIYSLSPRGHYFADIIYNLEKIGLSDPSSRVKVLRL